MKDRSFLNSSPVYLEMTREVLRVAQDSSHAELPLDRDAEGKLTAECCERVIGGLRALVAKKAFQGRVRAYCAIAANGVSLRRLSLPITAKEKFDQVLRLQIEAEFPLAPDELAWGYQTLPANAMAKQEVLVAAVKRQMIEAYRELFAGAGLDAIFTVAALARNLVCPEPHGTHVLLDIGNRGFELIIFEQGIPTALRTLPASAESTLAESFAKIAGANWNRGKIFVSGTQAEQVSRLVGKFGMVGEFAPLISETGTSPAILGLKKSVEQNQSAGLLLLQDRARPVAGRFNVASAEVKPWLAAAAALLALLILLPFAEAVVLKPFLSRKLASLESQKGRLATIDHELDFLQSLKQNQPPYLDALYVMAKSAPPGTRFDSITMDKRGEVSMHGMMQSGALVTDFRAKLIASGFFSIVTVEEQTPTPDRRVNLRMTALWKPADARASLTIGPTASEIQQAKTNHDAGGGGGFPGGMMFP